MPNVRETCLDAFSAWLRSRATDALAVGDALEVEGMSEAARRHAAGSLNYLFKSLDLIPDGIEDLGYLDDAMVLRVGAALALREAPGLRQGAPALAALAAEATLVAELLGGPLYERFTRYVSGLGRSTARGRSVDAILAEPRQRAALLVDLRGWAASYVAPGFSRDDKNLVKLEAFLDAKLPR